MKTLSPFINENIKIVCPNCGKTQQTRDILKNGEPVGVACQHFGAGVKIEKENGEYIVG